jgi:hypothetical protein
MCSILGTLLVHVARGGGHACAWEQQDGVRLLQPESGCKSPCAVIVFGLLSSAPGVVSPMVRASSVEDSSPAAAHVSHHSPCLPFTPPHPLPARPHPLCCPLQDEEGVPEDRLFPISAVTGRGVREAVSAVRGVLDELGPAEVAPETDALNITEVPRRFAPEVRPAPVHHNMAQHVIAHGTVQHSAG